MTESERERIVRQEHSQAVVRALWRTELEAIGRERREAMKLIDAQVEKVGRLLQDARASGLTMAEIGRLTGVSRPTLYALRARFGDAPGDVAFGVLQAVAIGSQTAGILSDSRGQKELKALIARGLVDEDVSEGDYGELERVLFLTDEGTRLLESWEFREHQEEKLRGLLR